MGVAAIAYLPACQRGEEEATCSVREALFCLKGVEPTPPTRFTKICCQYLRHLSGVDSVVDPPKFSHLGDYLINTNGIGHFRKQF